MIKIVAVVSPLHSSREAGSVTWLMEQLTSEWLPKGQPASSLRGLVVSEVTKPFDETSDVIAIVELWQDELVEGREGIGHLLPAASAPDLEASIWLTREHVLKAPVERETGVPYAGVKLVGTAFRRDDFSREAFFEYWWTNHAPISGAVPGVGGYTVDEVLETLRGDSSVDALLAQWRGDEALFEASDNSPEAAAAWEDVQRYAKTTGSFWLTHEHVLLAPPPTGPGLLEGGTS